MTNNLIHPKLDQVNIQQFDQMIKQMLQNDNSLIPKANIAPTIWRCSWYNTVLTDNNIDSYCYNKGDAVWVNTEDLAQFTAANKQYILTIILGNSVLRKKYMQAEGNETQIEQLCRDVVTGKVTGNVQGFPLFYIGDVTKKVQIRVSTRDHNTELPSNNAWWTDFFVNNDETKFQEIILSRAKELCQQQLESHLKDYHLSGIQDYWLRSYKETKQLSDFYLLQDMSNVTGMQDFNNTAGTSTEGFDYVVYYHQKQFTDDPDKKCIKWFRVWNSGKLEHGGIVKVDAVMASKMGDSLVYGGTHYKVNLAWSDSEVKAPVYKYSIAADSFYYESDYINIGDNKQWKIEDVSKLLDESRRYTVQLTPIIGSEDTPYSEIGGDETGGVYYCTKDVNTITNSSFCFNVQSNVKYYSYCTSGMAKNVEQGFK